MAAYLNTNRRGGSMRIPNLQQIFLWLAVVAAVATVQSGAQEKYSIAGKITAAVTES
jgi:hypothetical protein